MECDIFRNLRLLCADDKITKQYRMKWPHSPPIGPSLKPRLMYQGSIEQGTIELLPTAIAVTEHRNGQQEWDCTRNCSEMRPHDFGGDAAAGPLMPTACIGNNIQGYHFCD